MKIIHICSEYQPLVKIGGLADVTFGLSEKYIQKQHSVLVVLPHYTFIDGKKYSIADRGCLEYEKEGEKKSGTWVKILVKNIPVVLISSGISKEKVYNKDPLKDANFFVTFSLLSSIFLENTDADVIQLHDWHSASFAHFFKGRALIALTLHSPYLGKISAKLCKNLRIDVKNDFWRFFKSKFDLLPIMLKHVDLIVAVSKSFGKEIFLKGNKTLKKALLQKKDAVHGITNGISLSAWNPENNPHLKDHFNANMDIFSIIQKKISNKKFLQNKFKMKEGDFPLVVVIGRLVEQKGLSLIQEGLSFSQKLNAQVFLLGTGHPKTVKKFYYYNEKNVNGHYELTFDESLAHLLYASADFIYVPSKFEPCGLTQLIGMRYGAFPIVHAVGGLKDTVQDFQKTPISETKGIGTLFLEYDISDAKEAIARSLKLFRSPEHSKIIEHNMKVDFSWETPANDYLSLFTESIRSCHLSTQ